jgi:hypothetical protein
VNIVLETSSTDPDNYADCDCAVMELTPDLVELIQRRGKLTRRAWRQDHDLYELYFWCGMVDFYDCQVIEACQEAVAANATHGNADQLVRDWLADLESNGHALLPPGVDLQAHQPQRTECQQMILRCCRPSDTPQYEVAWSVIPKHTDIYVTTSGLPLKAMDAYVRKHKAGCGWVGDRTMSQ